MERSEEERPRPLQFGLKTVLGIVAAVSVLFGTLRWLGVPAQAGYVILLVLLASAAGAVALVVVIAQSAGRNEDRE